MLCMYMVYVQYAWYVYYCIHLSVCPSRHPRMCALNAYNVRVQCLYQDIKLCIYTMYIYYIWYLHSIYPSVHPSVHPCLCTLCVYFVCILSKNLGIILGCMLCVCYVCILYMVDILLYIYIYMCYIYPSVCPSACHACVLYLYTMHVCWVCICVCVPCVDTINTMRIL